MGNALIVGLISTLAVLSAFVGAYILVEKPDDLTQRVEAYAAIREGASGETVRKRKGMARFLTPLDRLLSGRAPGQRLALHLAQANLRMTPPEFLVIALGAGVAGGALGFVLRGHAASGLGGAALAFAAPWVLLERKRQKRIKLFHDQLIDVLTLIVGSLRGGHALPTALELVSKELDPPASEEFSRVLRETGFGLSQTEALNNLVKRMETDDLQLIVTAVNISHEVGGNLSLVLEKITETLRERIRLQGEIRVLTTQQRLTSYLLVALPFALGAAMAVISPSWIMRLFQPGWVRIIPAGAAAMETVGFFVCQKLTKIEV